MAENIKLEVVTPEKYVVEDDAQIVMAPGSCGEFGVLAGHTTFLTTLKTGALRYVDAQGKERKVFINSGFAEALPDKVTILAESAERRRDIDVSRAKDAMKRAQDRLDGNDSGTDVVRAKAALARAMHRLNVVEAISH